MAKRMGSMRTTKRRTTSMETPADRRRDKKMGIREGSKRDTMMDRAGMYPGGPRGRRRRTTTTKRKY